MLEEENPGCFDRDDKTFIDLYMKSGMSLTPDMSVEDAEAQ